MALKLFVRLLKGAKCIGLLALVSLFCFGFQTSKGLSAETKQAKALPLSTAQKWLYDRDHMKLVAQGEKVLYKFTRTSQLDDGYEDTVSLELVKIGKDGRNHYRTEFFTGKRNKPYPEMTNFLGSPLIMLYMNRSVWDLSKTRLKGHPNYLRNRIREALYKSAKIDMIKWTGSDGKEIDAIKIMIKPFTDNKYVGRFAHYSQTEYEFILSKAQKGEVLELRTRIPAKPKMDSQSIANMKKGKMTVLAKECEKVLTADDTKPLVLEVLKVIN